jgi:predicted ATPase
MISRIQALSFRSLQWTDQRLRRFQALVGPNASGKTTFMDGIAFLSELMRTRGNILETVLNRSSNFENLLWLGKGNNFQLAVEAEIPKEVRAKLIAEKQKFSHVRYELQVGFDAEANQIGIDHEVLWLINPDDKLLTPLSLFPSMKNPPKSLFLHGKNKARIIVKKTLHGNDNYYTEGKQGYMPTWNLGRKISAMANVPADEERFPVSLWFRDLLSYGVQPFILNSQVIRQPSPPGQGRAFRPDGSNLPWVIDELRKQPEQFQRWLRHIQTALEDIANITTVVRPEDRHCYLVIEYKNGATVPSWLISDGTLRLLALTIPAWLTDLKGTFLIEEPENGIHPSAIETVIQALSSMYDSQVLVATHSPVALNMLRPEDILCFAKNTDGATDIVAGNLHPALQAWKQGQPELGVLFASGILS